MASRLDRWMAGILIGFGILFQVFTFLPISKTLWLTVGNGLTMLAFIFTMVLVGRAISLYGYRSAEGRIWVSLQAMLIVLLIGIPIEILWDTPAAYTVFVIIAFAIVIQAIIHRLRSSGLRPDGRALAIGMAVVLGIALSIAYEAERILGGEGVHLTAVEVGALGLALTMVIITTFLATLLAKLLGGHLSRGWIWLAIGAGLFALFFGVDVMERAEGDYLAVLWLQGLATWSLLAVTWSAHYQVREHRKLLGEWAEA